jgi:glycerophosphoryl diester phosphodiesterase
MPGEWPRGRTGEPPDEPPGEQIDIIGHRGARGLFPENTLRGFNAAAALGVHAFELDVGLTRDGAVVVAHDPALNPDITRDPSGGWLPGPGPLLWMLTAAELARYDVGRIRPGSPTARLFPDQRSQDGSRVPSLAAVLEALSAAQFIIEIKTDPFHPDWTAAPNLLVDAVLADIDRVAAAGRVVLESFDWRVQLYLKRIRPEIRLAFLTRPDADPDPWWAGASRHESPNGRSTPAVIATLAPGSIWAPAHSDLTDADVREAHALGLAVVPWTVNQAADMRRLIACGVDGIISDYPDRLIQIVAEMRSG